MGLAEKYAFNASVRPHRDGSYAIYDCDKLIQPEDLILSVIIPNGHGIVDVASELRANAFPVHPGMSLEESLGSHARAVTSDGSGLAIMNQQVYE